MKLENIDKVGDLRDDRNRLLKRLEVLGNTCVVEFRGPGKASIEQFDSIDEFGARVFAAAKGAAQDEVLTEIHNVEAELKGLGVEV